MMEKAMNDIGYGVVTAHSPCAVSAPESVVAMRVAGGRARGAIAAAVGAWPRLEDGVIHPSADADINYGVRHIVAWRRGKL